MIATKFIKIFQKRNKKNSHIFVSLSYFYVFQWVIYLFLFRHTIDDLNIH
jgi:hypothetical protein